MPILVNSDDASRPSSQQLGDYLSGLGASYGERLMLTGAATSESGRDPGASHDNGIGFGMFGHNGSRLLAMQNYARANGQDVGDWRTQAGFALNELRNRPEGKAAASATTPEQVALAQMYYERPQGFTEQNPTAGRNFDGRLDTIRSLAVADKSAPPTFSAGSSAPSGGAAPALAPAATGTAAASASAPGMTAAPVGVGNAQLNAAVANMLRPPAADGSQPLVGYLADKGINTVLGGLKSLLGGGASAPPPSAPAPPASASQPLSPQAAPVATTPAPGGGGSGNATLPLFAGGAPPASPIVQPVIGPSSVLPTMAQGSPLSVLFGSPS